MTLSSEDFKRLAEALDDAFRDRGDFRRLARCLDIRLNDVVGDDARLPDIAISLIECAEAKDMVDVFVREAQTLRPSNRKLALIEAATLHAATETAELVDAGGGAISFKSRLKEALENLDVPGMQLVATHELSMLLDGATAEEANTLYLALLGNVKIKRSDEVVSALAPVLAKSVRARIGAGKRPEDVELDLTRARIRRIDLAGLDLHEADVAFADLRHANLDGANLWRSRGYAVDVSDAGLSRSNLEEARWHAALAQGARFHDCRMVSVFLKDADLAEAGFQRSRLQGAHFERANLTGARFEQANLADARFDGATIDDVAATSIALAVNWDKAYYDPASRALIEARANG